MGLKAMRMEDNLHLVVGISNIDAQVKRDKEYALAKNRANRDALTGVKNKHAYVDAELRLNQAIESHQVEPFALVVCDVNNLKLVNDNQGHHAGDDLIREACAIICNVFKHSPVFRIGGDEFLAILQGHDLQHASELTSSLTHINEQNAQTGNVVIAWGISEYHSDEDVATVFERADAAMYACKRSLKQ